MIKGRGSEGVTWNLKSCPMLINVLKCFVFHVVPVMSYCLQFPGVNTPINMHIHVE